MHVILVDWTLISLRTPTPTLYQLILYFEISGTPCVRICFRMQPTCLYLLPQELQVRVPSSLVTNGSLMDVVEASLLVPGLSVASPQSPPVGSRVTTFRSVTKDLLPALLGSANQRSYGRKDKLEGRFSKDKPCSPYQDFLSQSDSRRTSQILTHSCTYSWCTCSSSWEK